jgi:nucleotidyltransferase/DNA polymerase involved in DNA repair
LLVRKFGQSTGTWLHRVAHGIDDRPVVTESEPKSISGKAPSNGIYTLSRTGQNCPRFLPRSACGWPTT